MPHPNQPPTLALRQVYKGFDGGVQALAGVSLDVAAGEFIALLGPSGCGKSTVLRLVAGLEDPSSGEMQAPARTLAPMPMPTAHGQTAFVFQEPTLMPWASVFDNVWLPLRLRGVARSEAASTVRALLATVGLSDFERAHPAQLSGGMKMRTSIARALVTQPEVLLMDEPFAALDDITRHKLNADLLSWWQRLRPATVFVTHSIAEAVFLSQRVLVMSPRPGRIIDVIETNFPRDRSLDIRETPEFLKVAHRVREGLKAGHSYED